MPTIGAAFAPMTAGPGRPSLAPPLGSRATAGYFRWRATAARCRQRSRQDRSLAGRTQRPPGEDRRRYRRRTASLACRQRSSACHWVHRRAGSPAHPAIPRGQVPRLVPPGHLVARSGHRCLGGAGAAGQATCPGRDLPRAGPVRPDMRRVVPRPGRARAPRLRTAHRPHDRAWRTGRTPGRHMGQATHRRSRRTGRPDPARPIRPAGASAAGRGTGTDQPARPGTDQPPDNDLPGTGPAAGGPAPHVAMNSGLAGKALPPARRLWARVPVVRHTGPARRRAPVRGSRPPGRQARRGMGPREDTGLRRHTGLRTDLDTAPLAACAPRGAARAPYRRAAGSQACPPVAPHLTAPVPAGYVRRSWRHLAG